MGSHIVLKAMRSLDTLYPDYGFAKHKGYGTPQHLQALKERGPLPIHRRSFAPVARFERSNVSAG